MQPEANLPPNQPGCPCGHHRRCLTCLLNDVPCLSGPEPGLECARCTEGGGICEWPRCDDHKFQALLLDGIHRDTDKKAKWTESAIRTLYMAVISCTKCRQACSLRRRHETHTATVPGAVRAAWSNLTSAATNDDTDPSLTCTCCILKRAVHGPNSVTCHPKTVREQKENDACEFGTFGCASCKEDGNHYLTATCKVHRERVRRWAVAQLEGQIPAEAARHYARSLDYEIRACAECVAVNSHLTTKGWVFFRYRELGARVANIFGLELDCCYHMSDLISRVDLPLLTMPAVLSVLLEEDGIADLDARTLLETRYRHMFSSQAISNLVGGR